MSSRVSECNSESEQSSDVSLDMEPPQCAVVVNYHHYYSLMNKSVYFQDDCFSLEVCLLTMGNCIVIFTAPFIQICSTEVNVTKQQF